MKFASELVKQRFELINPILIMIAVDADSYMVVNHGYESTITSALTTLDEDIAVNRTSRTHREGRAYDMRTRDIPSDVLDDVKRYILGKYGHIGALSASTLEPNLIYDKPHGTGPHWHVQIRPGV